MPNPVDEDKINVSYNKGFVYVEEGEKIQSFSYQILRRFLKKTFPKQY